MYILFEKIKTVFIQIGDKFVEQIPQILSSATILLAGLLFALLLQAMTRKLIFSVDKFFNKTKANMDSVQSRVHLSNAYILSKILFWSVLILFINVASNIMGWVIFSDLIGSIILFLPNIIAASVILFLGIMLSGYLKNLINRSPYAANLPDHFLIATIVQWAVILIVIMLSLEQLGLNLSIFSHMMLIFMGVILGGGALAFSLGAKTLTANVIAAQYAKKYISIGDTIRIANIEGEVLDIQQTSIIVESADGSVAIIPAKELQNELYVILNNKES